MTEASRTGGRRPNELRPLKIERGVNVHASARALPRSWFGTSAGYPSSSYTYLISGKREIEVRLDMSGPQNKQLFDRLHDRAPEIESCLGMKPRWERRDGHKSSYIIWPVAHGFSLHDEAGWEQVQIAMLTAMKQMAACFGPHLKSLASTMMAPMDSGEPGPGEVFEEPES